MADANQNANAVPSFDPLARFPSMEAALEMAEKAKAAGLLKAFQVKPDQGEYIIVDISPKAKAKPASKPASKASKPAGKAKGKKGLEARQQAIGKALAAPRPAAKPAKPDRYDGAWRKLESWKWQGIWAELKEKAEKGQFNIGKGAWNEVLPIRESPEGMKGLFASATHIPFKRKIEKVLELIRAKDVKGLKAHKVKGWTTTPVAIGKLRDLAIASLSAKESKANGKTEKLAKPAENAEKPAEG